MINDFLLSCKEAYYKGSPIISDEEYDSLVDIHGEPEVVGFAQSEDAVKLPVRMYSLNKMYEGEDTLPDRFECTDTVRTPKLDGCAICITYHNGEVTCAQVRGDGKAGKIVTDRLKEAVFLPQLPEVSGVVVVVGEFVIPKTEKNARNLASGYLNRKEEKTLPIGTAFVAYDVSAQYWEFETYEDKLQTLSEQGFRVVTDANLENIYPTDGEVIRINSENKYHSSGYTNKFPRGAIAVKQRTEGVSTIVTDVIWQTGKSGKVTPVALLEPVEIDGAMVSKATLNNPDYMQALGITEVPCRVKVERAGGIIPKILALDHQKS